MLRWFLAVAILFICVCCSLFSLAYADSLKSSHYTIDESVLGGGGLIQENSSNYQAGESIGDIGVDNSSSTNYQLNAGYTTTSDPALTFAILNPNANFGSFSTSSTAVATSTFEVSDYTSYGYVVQIAGTTPSNGTHSLPAMATTGSAVTGSEQFGINVVANTSPNVGANPNNGLFGNGSAAANYNTSNQFRFVSGETIASAPKSSGLTIYTISYIIDVASLTPGGIYSGNQVLICTGTY